MKNIWLDGIMGVIVGDALGLPVQFLSREEIKKSPVTQMQEYGTFHMPKGTWSDDGSMTLATMCSIYEKGMVDLEDIMKRFVAWNYDGKYTPLGESFDQGITCTTAIVNYVRDKDIRSCGLRDERSNGNGSLMRIMPVCLYVYEHVKSGEISETEGLELIHDVSALTHAHLRSKMACGFYYFMVKAILDHEGTLTEKLQKGVADAVIYYHKKTENLVQMSYYGRLFHLDEFANTKEQDIRSSGYVVDSLEAAVWSLITTDSFKEAALRAVNLGDDTDTVGAIACGLAGLYYGYEGIPAEWRNVIRKKEEIYVKCRKANGKEIEI